MEEHALPFQGFCINMQRGLPSICLAFLMMLCVRRRERENWACVCVCVPQGLFPFMFHRLFPFYFPYQGRLNKLHLPCSLMTEMFCKWKKKKKKTGCEYQHPSHSQCFKFSAFTLKDLMFIFSEVQFQPQNNLFSFICTFPWFWLWKSVRQKQEERD